MSITTQRNFFVHNGSQFLSVCDKSDIVATDSFKATIWFMGSHPRSNYLAELLSCVPKASETVKKGQLNQIIAGESSVSDRSAVATRRDDSFVEGNLAIPTSSLRIENSAADQLLARGVVSSVKRFATATQTIVAGLDELSQHGADGILFKGAPPAQMQSTENGVKGSENTASNIPTISTYTQSSEIELFDQTARSCHHTRIPTVSTATQSIYADVVEESGKLVEHFATSTQTSENELPEPHFHSNDDNLGENILRMSKSNETIVYAPAVRFSVNIPNEKIPKADKHPETPHSLGAEIIEQATRHVVESLANRKPEYSTPSECDENEIVNYERPSCSSDENFGRSTPRISFHNSSTTAISDETFHSHRKRRQNRKSQLSVDEEFVDLAESNKLRSIVEKLKMSNEEDKLIIAKLRTELAEANNNIRKMESSLAKDANNRHNQELVAFEKESKFMCDISALKTELAEVHRQMRCVVEERNAIDHDYAQLSIHYSQFWNQHQNCDHGVNGLDGAEMRQQLQELELRARNAENELNASQTRLVEAQNELETANQTIENYEKNFGSREDFQSSSAGARGRSSWDAQPERQKSLLERLMGNVFDQSPAPVANGSHPRGEFNESWSVQLDNAIAERDKILEDMMEIQNSLENAQNNLENALSEAKSVKDLSETLRNENEMLNNEIAQLKSELTSCVSQSKSLETQVVTNEVSYMQELVEKQTIIGNLKHCNEMLKSKGEKFDTMEERINSLEASLNEKEKEICRLNDFITTLNATIEQKKIENANLFESVRLMKKSNQSLIERTDIQMGTMQSLHESNEALSGLLRTSQNKLQQLEKDLKQSTVDKNVLVEVKQENEKLRSDSKILKERIKKGKTNENVKANKIASLQSENKYLMASKSELLKDAKNLEESLLEIQLENHIQTVSRSDTEQSILNTGAKNIKSKNLHVEKGIRKLIDDITRDCIRNSNDNVRQSADASKDTKQFKNHANASIYCSDLPINCKGELIRLCKLIIETHCIDALSLDELRLLHEYVYIAGLRKQTFKFPCPAIDLSRQQMQVDQLKEKLNGAKVKIAQLKSQELSESCDSKIL